MSIKSAEERSALYELEAHIGVTKKKVIFSIHYQVYAAFKMPLEINSQNNIMSKEICHKLCTETYGKTANIAMFCKSTMSEIKPLFVPTGALKLTMSYHRYTFFEISLSPLMQLMSQESL